MEGITGEKGNSPTNDCLRNGVLTLGYTQVDVPTNTLCDCNYAGSVWLQDEKHNWGNLAAGLRYYLNPNSAINIFVDGNLRADWFIAGRT
jgi:hypothetical protein